MRAEATPANEGPTSWAECAIRVAAGKKEHRAAVEAEARQMAAAGPTCSLPLHCGVELFFVSESSDPDDWIYFAIVASR